MNALPFDKPGRFYRGNLHMHSTNSDGLRTPEETLAAYRAQGYDFVSLTDHFLPKDGIEPIVSRTDHLRTDDFTTIPGAEIHGHGMENGDLWHLVANGLPPDFPWLGPVETGPEIAARTFAAGAYVSIAHPAWNAASIVDAETLVQHVHAVEVYNHGCAVEVDRGEGWPFADLLLAKSHRLHAIATDDAHNNYPGPPELDAYGGWVQVKSESLEPESLLAALKVGHFYSSTGPELHDVRIDGDHIHIACSPVEFITVTGLGSRSQRLMPGPLDGGTLPLNVNDFRAGCYCRVSVVAANGTRAWTNPIWLDE